MTITRAFGPTLGDEGWQRTPDGGGRYVHVAPSGARAVLTIAPPHAGALEICAEPTLDARITRLVALGPGLAGWLTLAGWPVLHGNTARIGGRDLVVTGPSGVGKSTLTATLIDHGAQLVADDLAVFDPLDPPAVRPGFGRIKLWDDSVTHLGRDPDALSRVHPEHAKRSVVTPVARGQVPVGAIAVLARGDGPITRMSGGAAVQALLGNHRVPELLDGAGQVRWLHACAALARAVPILAVPLPGPLPALAEIARALADVVRAER